MDTALNSANLAKDKKQKNNKKYFFGVKGIFILTWNLYLSGIYKQFFGFITQVRIGL